MSCFEIYYDGGAKKMRPINNFEEYAAIRNSAKNRRNTKAAREGNDEAKRHMVQFCYSCLPNDDGTLKGSKRMSNSVGMDIDFAKDMPKKEFEAAFEIMKDNILDKAQQLRLLMLERSATKGLHLVFERHPELTQEENLEWAQKLLGVEFDKGAKDITRVFFTPTADPKDLFFCKDDLFINKEVETAANPPAVGADPCVRPTTAGRTESAKEVEAKDGNGKEEANAKSAEICRSDIGRTHGSAPTGGSCTQSTTSGSCTQSTTGGSCTQSTTGGSCRQSTTGGSCTQSTTGGSCTQSTTCGSCTQSTTCGSCTQSTTGGSCTQSTTCGSCTQSMTCGSCTQSTTCGSCTQSTTCGSCTHSTTCGSCTQSTTCGSCTHSTTCGSCTQSTTGGNLEYNGIPYSAIVQEFLRQFNNGQTPVEGNRNVMTFELAKALRSICDYNLDFMKQVIPRYDNFPEEEYVRTLQSAIDEPRRGVSYKLQKVLEVLYRNEKKTEGKVDFETENELPPAMPQRLPYPLGFLSAKVPEMYRPAVCEAVFAPLSTYVHGVKFRYWDGVEHEPTFMSVLTAPMSIGKGCVRKPISIILDELVKKDESNRARESEWKQKNPSSKQKRDPRPADICVQVLIDNLTDAVFNQRVYDADKNGQRFLYTSVDELDTLKKITSRGTASEVSVIIRKAFDNSKHGQERVGADSVTGIAPLRFNFNASTTNRNFQQFFAREMTTGTVTRLSLATIIKPSDAKRPVFKEYDANYCEEVRKLTQKLSMLSGEIACPKCNKFAEQLCDENEQLASLYGSDPYLVLSYRATVIAWLKGMMLYVMNGEKWTKDIQDYMEWSLRYDLWVKMHVIGKMLDAAFDDEENATSKRGPMNMLELLKDEFTMEDLILVRKKLGKSVDQASAKNQLQTWRARKLIDFDGFETVIKKIKKNV